jgi:hypothetical protein
MGRLPVLSVMMNSSRHTWIINNTRESKPWRHGVWKTELRLVSGDLIAETVHLQYDQADIASELLAERELVNLVD